MKNILSYKSALTICAVVLALIGIRMHIDPASVANNEFPNAQGDAHNIYHIIASLLFVIASTTFFAGRVEDARSQQLLLNGCVLGFAVMFITVGAMTVTQVGDLIIATIVFAVLTALCLYKKVTHQTN
tara:strand:+ start:509 stop:892 length:384 start_codon:yes stop_codon:yes gene_type:complete